MTDMENEVVDKELFAVLYGDSGVGKTVLTQAIAQALRARAGGRILFCDSSDGWVTLDDFPSLKANTSYLSVPDFRDLPAIGEALMTRKKGFEDFTVAVLDEGSSWFMDMLHAWVREAEGLSAGEPLPEIEGKHYGPPTHALLNTISYFHKTPGLHVIMTSHEQERGRTEQSATVGPSLSPQFLKGVNQRVHLMARVEAALKQGGYVRTVQTQPSRRVRAKSRISTLDVVEAYEDVPEKIAEWVFGEGMVTDLSKNEAQVAPVDDDEVRVDDDDTDDEPTEV
jgi:ABC-type dipeptide/oligopeptide/nickel transport system ATPase component